MNSILERLFGHSHRWEITGNFRKCSKCGVLEHWEMHSSMDSGGWEDVSHVEEAVRDYGALVRSIRG